MKPTKLFLAVAMIAMAFSTNSLFAQSRVSIAGKADMVSNDNKSWALEVNGKVVTGYNYSHFKSTNGAYFAVEDKNGKWGICDASGTFLFKCQFAKTSVSDNTAMLYSSLDAAPKIYDCKTKTYVEAEQAGADFFDKGRDFNPEKMTRDNSVEAAKALSAQVPEYGRFEIRMNGIRQQLVVDGKVLYEAQEFTVLSTAADFTRTGAWFFIVKNKGLYGTYGLALWEKDGQKKMEHKMFVPLEYTFIRPDETPRMVRCTSKSGVVHIRAWTGQRAN